MIKANISQKNKQQAIEATGSILEMANDVAVLLSGIHAQLKAVSPAAAKLFRTGVQKMVADSNSPCWTSSGNQTGIAVQLPDEDESHDP